MGTMATVAPILKHALLAVGASLSILSFGSQVQAVPEPDVDTCLTDAVGARAEDAAVSPAAMLAGIGSDRWAAVSADYIECLAERGQVVAVELLTGSAAIAQLRDGTRVEFTTPSRDAARYSAQLVGLGVELSVTAIPDLGQESAARPEAGVGWSLAKTLAVVVTFAFGMWLAVMWWRARRNNPKEVRSGKIEISDGPAGKVKKSDIPTTRFSDVAGAKEAVADLQELVDVLKHPERYEQVGARAPRGALLVGPPGTGKTLLARAVAGEAGVPFFTATGSDFVEMYVGVGAKRVRALFDKARKAGRAIVFIDEIDAVGRRRSGGSASGGEVEHENTIIALLAEMDGFTQNQVIVLAATNRADVLDEALCRPGRLDRRVHVGLPDERERAAILGIHLRNKPVGPDVDTEAIARRTTGMSGAQLEQVCNEAALEAAREGVHVLRQRHLSAAVEYVVMGRARRTAKVSEQDRLVTAWHEAGHTVAAMTTPHADRPVSVSIVPRGAAGGVTWMSQDDNNITTRQKLFARLVVALSGRAAEERLLDGEYTAGAAGDLETASTIARTMVERFGMSELGLIVRAGDDDTLKAANELLETARQVAREQIETHHELLEEIANRLLASDDLGEGELRELSDRFALDADVTTRA